MVKNQTRLLTLGFGGVSAQENRSTNYHIFVFIIPLTNTSIWRSKTAIFGTGKHSKTPVFKAKVSKKLPKKRPGATTTENGRFWTKLVVPKSGSFPRVS